MIVQSLQKIEPYATLNMDLLEVSETFASIAMPLDGNRNDKNTMFAGSIYSVLVLTGWTLARAATFGDAPCSDLVIAKSKTRYLRPVRSDTTTKAVITTPPFHKSESKVVIDIAVELLDAENNSCARFSASYVAIENPSSE